MPVIKKPWLGKEEMELDQGGAYHHQMSTAHMLVDNVHGKLEVAADEQRRSLRGLHPEPVIDDPFYGYSPTTLIQIAGEASMRLSALYTGFGHAFAFCGERVVELQGDARRWQDWERLRAKLAARVNMALLRLRFAAAHAEAAVDATNAAASFPRKSPSWIAWVSATEQHFRRALDEAAMARDALQQLPITVVHDFSEAWKLLSP